MDIVLYDDSLYYFLNYRSHYGKLCQENQMNLLNRFGIFAFLRTCSFLRNKIEGFCFAILRVINYKCNI